MADTFSPIAKTFAFQLENRYEDQAKVIALFTGTADCRALATDTATGKQVFCDANPAAVGTMMKGICDAVMVDGVMPEIIDGELTIPDTKGGTNFLRAVAKDPRFSINGLKKWLTSNGYLINRIIIKTKTQDQFDNPITFATSSPTDDKGSVTITPTNYSTPEMLQTNKIIIDNIEGTVLQDDTVIEWTLNPGEVVNITLEFTEIQQQA